MSQPPTQLADPVRGPLATLIFSSRWLQLPLYLGLIVAQGVYVILFVRELWHLITGAVELGEQDIMLIVLGLIDVVMIPTCWSWSSSVVMRRLSRGSTCRATRTSRNGSAM